MINLIFTLLAVLLPQPQSVTWSNGRYPATTVPKVRYVTEIPEAGSHQDEAYRLEVDAYGIRIETVTHTGEIRARQTLAQLTDGDTVEGCRIVDWAAFPIRGFLQDTGRSYISIEELEREIDALAKFKINVFHWHLTENQAWRLESRQHPRINAPETMTRFPGKYYTQDEARELVRFCAERGVTLIPEIDMPGHSQAFVRAFGVDMQSKEGMKILKDLVDEACDVFKDCEYFHIGTDEVKIYNETFVPEMVAFIRRHGKKVISYNPGWHYEPGEIDMTFLWSYRGTAQPGIPAIDSKLHYLNHYDTFVDPVLLYGMKPYGRDECKGDIVGSILALWHDRRVDDERQMIIQNGLYPNMLILAERAWRGGEPEDFAEFEDRMLYWKDRNFAGYPFAYVRQSNVKWGITVPFPNGGDLSRSFAPESEDPSKYRYGEVNGAGAYLRHVWGTASPCFYENPEPDCTAYAYTNVYSPVDREAGLWFESQNYSRSETDLPPRQGTWDYKGSRIWINGEEILPPVWESSHTEKSNEIPLMNENMVSRPPIRVTLHKGWNRVLIKLPVGQFSTPEVRLVKWMFSCVFVTPDGESAIPDLVYDCSGTRSNNPNL